MARIVSGKAKNTPLDVPEGTRPITDRIKTSVFDILNPIITGASCLDLYAGTGGIGLEALSRGAKEATFVEQDEMATKLLQNNIKRAHLEELSTIINDRVEEYFLKAESQFSIVFIDPPFPNTRKNKLNILTKSIKVCDAQGYIVFRHPKAERFPETISTSSGAINRVLSKKYGISVVDFYEKVFEQKPV